jgi:hypothetical protein
MCKHVSLPGEIFAGFLSQWLCDSHTIDESRALSQSMRWARRKFVFASLKHIRMKL